MNIYVIPSAGGSAERLLPSDRGRLDPDWSPDGKSLVFGMAFDLKGSIYTIDLSSRKVSALPGSRGFFSPHWSPDGRYISGTILQSEIVMLFDTATMWSHYGNYIYFENFTAPDKIETVADVSKAGRWTAGTMGQWFGLAPDDSPLVARDISTQEIFALEMQVQ
jgi:WD40 repeat protein